MNRDNIKEIQKRTRQYWYVDGTFEFSISGLCFLLALFFYFQERNSGSGLSDTFNLVLVILLIIGGAGINWMVQKIKERVTFPRTGYVAYKTERGLRRLGIKILIGLVAGLLSALITLGLIQLSAEAIIRISRASPHPVAWMPGITGLMFFGALIFLAVRLSIPRYFLISVFSLGIGAGLMFSGLGNNFGLTSFYGLMGLVLLVSGVITLRNYLHSTSLPSEAANG